MESRWAACEVWKKGNGRCARSEGRRTTASQETFAGGIAESTICLGGESSVDTVAGAFGPQTQGVSCANAGRGGHRCKTAEDMPAARGKNIRRGSRVQAGVGAGGAGDGLRRELRLLRITATSDCASFSLTLLLDKTSVQTRFQ